MFVPLYDYNPLRHIRTPWVTRSLILANVLIYIAFQDPLLVGPLAAEAVLASFGMIPAVVSGYAYLPPELQRLPEETTLVTYMFLHAGWLHLGTNMLFLWVFGDNVEDALGHARFLVFYLVCGVAGGLLHLASAPNSEVPLVGASGAIAGCIAAYLMLHPRVKLWVLVLMRIPLPIPAWIALGAWVGAQIVNGILVHEDGTAWWAHIGGLVAGAILVVPLRRKGVPLFDRGLDRPA
ncbi:rhomboid family intramembrane serine protease [Blastochloris viridis]|uniref:Rhomboid family serine protease n=1 Tax=Blastochloris viridis TaxID=1079 RepID=A0A0H5BP45_BLAVI|nr:rhomboid family intramembrane serine protease [Blastochloris viridis]ALK07996.1 Rhomboid protease GluP [Blastochloris viridis]BAR98748.1 rhomboid family serine protease [Blastochloris viridis]CUU43918.1 Rhomboid protease gluP [Blastochloris viridis]